MRSADGVHWIEEEGEAYVPGVSFHKDGYVEDWYKYERIHIYQDRITRSTKEIKVRIQAESNFNPATEIDTQTLHFGAASEVNYGRGAEVKSIAIDGKDLIVTF